MVARGLVGRKEQNAGETHSHSQVDERLTDRLPPGIVLTATALLEDSWAILPCRLANSLGHGGLCMYVRWLFFHNPPTDLSDLGFRYAGTALSL